MSKRKILLFLFVGASALWGIFQLFSPSAPNAEVIYGMVHRLYARSLEDVNRIMGRHGEKSSSGFYTWEFDNKDKYFFSDNSIECVFEENKCVAVFYMEYFYGAKKADKRYQVLLKGLSKKLGTPVRDNKGFLVWSRGEEKIGLIRMILPGTEQAGVGIAVNEKDFVLSKDGMDK
ncbi:hypothetical protein [Fretibacterium fastidiosum]|uniref:hypothetical protein n=1 Tax=Fretibacterium fastidiosum TaxID=651822 RepID=UPI001AD82C63|nr:hypothetical protein [Fretibacterium fastidiosum]